ncbi:MAG: helix-turn-helix transcriptional regulator, partial [Oscillospiraceae bacterium]|nr:helix-turn-helix transcriptional regulator [Oscillospiraceae bacterium]
MTLGEKIYKLRTERNLSQGDLSEILEVSRQSVSKWENGAATPDLDKIIKLSEIFGITIDELVKNEDVSVSVSEEPKNT